MRVSKLLLVMIVCAATAFCAVEQLSDKNNDANRRVDAVAVPAGGAGRTVETSVTQQVVADDESDGEWRELAEGESVDRGSHVRMNLSTGKKHVKIERKDRGGSSIEAVAVRAEDGSLAKAAAEGLIQRPNEEIVPLRHPIAVEDVYESVSEESPDPSGLDARFVKMRDVLLGLPEPDSELETAIKDQWAYEKLAPLLERLWARRQEELREAFASAKTEAHQLQEVLQRVMNVTQMAAVTAEEAREVVHALEDVEYLVSQYHNVDDFVGMGGVPVMTQLLQHSNLDLAAHGAWVIGSAGKYSPNMHAECVKYGTIVNLVELLQRSLTQVDSAASVLQYQNAGAISVAVENAIPQYNSALNAAKKTLYALGGILRSNAAGLKQFHNLGGDNALLRSLHVGRQLITSSMSDSLVANAKRNAPSVCLKTIRLVTDLYEDVRPAAGYEVEGEFVDPSKLGGARPPAAGAPANFDLLCKEATSAVSACLVDTGDDSTLAESNEQLAQSKEILSRMCVQ